MTLEKILIIDDDGNVRSVLFDLLQEMGLTVLAVSTLAQARELVLNDSFDAILCDVQLPDGNGLDFLVEVRERNPNQKMIIMTGFATMDSAIKAIRLGVFDYLTKPIDPMLLEGVVQQLSSVMKLEVENRYLRREVADLSSNEMVWGESLAMREVMEMVNKVAHTEATVLIQGESGCGKEMIARAICKASSRSENPFIKVNCAAVPASLMESEFFGHEKGAFTGAVQRRHGRFELADGGTILLDEITEIPLELQVKLLRVLQEREFERVGGSKTIKVNVRVLATTNRNLVDEVSRGNFREDLYYRLNVFPIVLPPLRARQDDGIMLANFFLNRFARRDNKPARGLEDRAVTAIREYPWPGNVRELQNVIERAVILSGSKTKLSEEDLSLPDREQSRDKISLSDTQEILTIHHMEREMIRRALKRCKGNRTHAADMLGISLRTLRNRLAEYREKGLEVE